MTTPKQLTHEQRSQLAALFQNAYSLDPSHAAGWTTGIPLEETLCITEGDRVASFLRIKTFSIWAGETLLPMGGIGGVSTWCDCQGRGHAGSLVREAIRVMRDRGQVVSALYPFMHTFYRQYGWESCGRRIHYGPFKSGDLIPAKSYKKVRAITGPEDWRTVARVYTDYAKRYFGMVDRHETDWRRSLRELFDGGGQAYCVEEDGIPTGYMFLRLKFVEDKGKFCRIPELFFTTAAAAEALFGFLAKLPRHIVEITLVAPPKPDLSRYFIHPPACRLGNEFMYRVVDVGKAVSIRRYTPALKGSVCVTITDEHGEWNNGAWTFEFADGEATVSRGGNSDIALTIQQFSNLYSGGMSVADEAAHGFLPPSPALEILDRAFTRQTPCLTDFF